MSDNDLQPDAPTLVAPCAQDARETDANGEASTAVAQRPKRAKRRGAEALNRRAVTHGLRMVNGRLPQGASWIRRESDGMKRLLERAVVEVKGELSILNVATVNEVVTWERHRLLAARWLRIAYDDLDHDQRLNFSREVAKSASERNKALRSLGIDKSQRDAWDALRGILDAEPATDHDTQPVPAPNASDAYSVAQEGNAE